jgi:DNA end-binding protein Ku
MRSIWTGSLAFGLINIPIRLYSASYAQRVDLDMLHKKDNSPIRYAIICKLEDKEIPYKEVVKGYQYEEGEYVTITSEDFESIAIEKTNLIDIQQFTDASEIDSVYFDKPYFLEPQKGATKAYTLLREALNKSGKVALAKFTLRNREHLAVVKVHNDALILNQLRYHEEIRDSKELSIPEKTTATAKEIKMAMQLIDQLTEHFKPEKYKDTYVKDLQAVIKAKSKGKLKVTKKQKKVIEKTKTEDILKKLKASLGQTKSNRRQARA